MTQPMTQPQIIHAAELLKLADKREQLIFYIGEQKLRLELVDTVFEGEPADNPGVLEIGLALDGEQEQHRDAQITRIVSNWLKQWYRTTDDSEIARLVAQIVATEQTTAQRMWPPPYDGDVYPMNACVWFRNSTGEWVLELEGVINDTHYSIRHTAPGDLEPENAIGLPTHYDVLEAAEALLDTFSLPDGPEGAVWAPTGCEGTARLDEEATLRYRALKAAVERARPAPVRMEDAA